VPGLQFQLLLTTLCELKLIALVLQLALQVRVLQLA
jgi:hypothetical protein